MIQPRGLQRGTHPERLLLHVLTDPRRRRLRLPRPRLQHRSLPVLTGTAEENVERLAGQHRIEGMLADIDQRLNAYRAGREDAKLRLRAYLHLATNAHAFYLACDEGRRRLCNQAFFTKITLTEHLVSTTGEF